MQYVPKIARQSVFTGNQTKPGTLKHVKIFCKHGITEDLSYTT